MEKAKSAVSGFLNRSGQHDTTVDEQVAPAVTQEEIKPTRHEEVQEAIDREVHQDHYHTTVQPIEAQEVMPEKHLHQMRDVQQRTFEHGDDEKTRLALEEERARFQSESVVHETRTTAAAAPAVAGEHVHHHVHETVQPVVHKEVVAPEVIHTTIPIHETHRAAAEHHGTSVLPTKHLDEFTSTGGSLAGMEKTAHETYEGDPRPYNPQFQQERTDADVNFKEHDGLHQHGHGHETTGTTGTGTGFGTGA